MWRITRGWSTTSVFLVLVGRLGPEEDLRRIAKRRPDSVLAEERKGETASDRGPMLLNGKWFLFWNEGLQLTELKLSDD